MISGPTTAPPRDFQRQLSDKEKVREFVGNLKKGDKYSERDLFSNLRLAYDYQAEDDEFEVKELNTRKEFNRVAAVYNKNMHSAFILPVWAAVYLTKEDQKDKTDQHKGNRDRGFVLYPRLSSVRTLLDVEGLEEEDKKSARKSILRHTLAPVALAIDTLHTPVANRRPMFYHRDISVDTVFLKTVEHHPVSGGRYRNAKLKLTELSTGCFEDRHKKNSLGGSKYFHHPDPWKTTKEYLKEHDWFSFGVFIVEVLTKLAGQEFHRSPADHADRAGFYVEAAECLKSISSDKLWERFGLDYTEGYKRYADIALQCLRSENGAFDLTLDHDPYQFEYGVGLQTAKLLKLHHDSRPGMYYEHDDTMAETLSECQACLLRKPVRIPTRSYRSGKESKAGCEECDKFYCAQCHTNGERLFCPLYEHGPTRTSIGGDAYFALILYGKDFRGRNQYAFERDAENIRNVLMHSMICGIPVSNLVLSALFDEAGLYNSKTMLERACEDLKREIVKKKDKFNFHLFVFYSGHGSEQNNGDWCPTDSDTDMVSLTDINNTLSLLRGREEVIGRDQHTIRAGLYGQVTYILDHCYPPPKGEEWPAILPKVTHKLTLSAPQLGEAYLQKDGNSSVITDWLCNFLRSLIHKECTDGCSECLLNHVDYHISAKCHSAYLDAECLTKFMTHCPSSNKYGRPATAPTFLDRVIKGQKIILAPYHADGVRMNAFAFEKSEAVEEQSGSGPVGISFKRTLDFKNLSEHIMVEMKMATAVPADGYPRLCFLTNGVGTACSTEYDLVWESDVPHILALGSLKFERNPLSPSVLYYRVVEKPLQVTFKFNGKQDPSTYKLNMKRDEETVKLETARVPSLLVCMVHHLFLMYQNTARKDPGKDAANGDDGKGSNNQQPDNDDDDEKVIDDDTKYDSHYHYVEESKRSEDSLKTSEEVRNSFANFLYKSCRFEKPLNEFGPDDWKLLVVEAGKYKEGRYIFNIYEMEDGKSICIEWQARTVKRQKHMRV